MKKYLTIGELSNLSGISQKSIRYYESIGIFKPAYINKETSYRYYRLDQLLSFGVITFFIETGIPLKELNNYKLDNGEFDLKSIVNRARVDTVNKVKKLQSNLRVIDNIESHMDMLNNSNAGDFKQTIEMRKLLVKELCIESMDLKEIAKYAKEQFEYALKNNIEILYQGGLLYKHSSNKYYLYMEVLDSTPISDNIMVISKGLYSISTISVSTSEEMTNRVLSSIKDCDIIYVISDIFNSSLVAIEQRLIKE